MWSTWSRCPWQETNSSTGSECKRTVEMTVPLVLGAVGCVTELPWKASVFSSLSSTLNASLLYWWSDNVLQKSKMKINFSVKSEPSMLCKKLCRPRVTLSQFWELLCCGGPFPSQYPLWNSEELLCVSSTWNQWEHRPRRLQLQFSIVFNLK